MQRDAIAEVCRAAMQRVVTGLVLTAGSKWSRAHFESGRGSLILYIVGGFTNEELQMVHELSAKYSLNVYIGGTSMHTSKAFVEEIKKIPDSRIR